ncbi:MAG: FAD-binding oxidoreductase [Parachlamydiaceae bacterium]|nr:FAD-binding oxidoreductase [Parachlamydiaceae bacterium]
MVTTLLPQFQHQDQYHFPCSSIVADGVDYLALMCPHQKDAKNIREKIGRLVARILSLGVFPIALGMDMTYLTCASIAENIRYVLAKTPEQTAERLKIAQNCSEARNKCLRGLLAFPQNILGADMITMHFQTADRKDMILPLGKLYKSHAEKMFPSTAEEVANIIKLAKEQNRKISIKGAGYAQGKQTLPPGDHDICIDVGNFKKIEIDVKNKLATVGAGVRWGELQNEADKHGMATIVQQASNVFSIGGSVGGANCHGWDHRWGSVGNTVVSMQVIRPDGEVVTTKRGDDLFSLVLGGYGLFGVITEVTLQLTENVPLLVWGEKVEIDDYIDYYRMIQSNPGNYMHLYRLSIDPKNLLKEGYAQNYSAGNIKSHQTKNLVNEPAEGALRDRIMFQFARHFPSIVSFWWSHESKDILTLKKAMRNEIMRPPIEATFNNHSVSTTEWLQEYFLPAEHLADFIRYLGTVLDKNEVKLLNCSIRPVVQDKFSKLGYAKEGERFAVVLFFTQFLQNEQVDKTRQWVREVVDKVIEMKGTYYLPYMHFPTRNQFRKCYPQYKEVVKMKEIYDPQSIFENQLYNEYYR